MDEHLTIGEVAERSGLAVRPRRDVYIVPGSSDPEGVLPDKQFTEGQDLEFLGRLRFSDPCSSADKADGRVDRRTAAAGTTAYFFRFKSSSRTHYSRASITSGISGRLDCRSRA